MSFQANYVHVRLDGSHRVAFDKYGAQMLDTHLLAGPAAALALIDGVDSDVGYMRDPTWLPMKPVKSSKRRDGLWLSIGDGRRWSFCHEMPRRLVGLSAADGPDATAARLRRLHHLLTGSLAHRRRVRRPRHRRRLRPAAGPTRLTPKPRRHAA